MIAINKQLNLRGRYLILIILLLTISFPGYSQSTHLQHFSTKNGLPSNNCYYTLQDSKGYIWVATDAGVSRFDGKIFENFSIDDGLPDNQILQLKEDKSGKIWFLALNGELSYFFNGKIYNETNDKLLKLLKFNAVIVSFFQDSKGRIWFGTNKNILVMWDGKTIMKYISADLEHQYTNTFIHEDKSGTIWAFSNECVRVFNNKTFTITAHGTLPLSYKTILNLPDKTLGYIDKNGLNIRTGNKQYLLLKIDTSLLNNDPGYFFLDKNDDLWLSNSNGIYHIEPSGKTTQYLKNISCSQTIKDSKNNMWFTTTSGIYMLPQKDERLYVINKTNGLNSDMVKSLVKDDRNRLWLGLDEGNISLLDLNTYHTTRIQLPDKKKYNVIKHLVYDSLDQTMYFAADYGLGRINNIYGTPNINYLKETNKRMFVVKSLSLRKDHTLAIALSSGVYILPYRKDKLEFTLLYFKQGIDFFINRAYCVFYDKDQNLWFSNVSGLSEYSNGILYNYSNQNLLLTKRINDIQKLDDGTIVLATDGYGVVFLKNKNVVKVITRKDGLANNICKRLFVKDNYIWVVTNNGINRIPLKNKQRSVESFEYTNAMLADDVNDLFIDDQYAYFATNCGLVYFSYHKENTNHEAPKVLISSIINNKTKLGLNSAMHILAPSNNSITFTYSAIDFQNKTITYRYRLKTESNWTETKSRRLEFPSLEPGDYTFEISSKSNKSNWSTPTRVNFSLKRHFWQTNLFLVAVFLFAGFAFYKVAVVITKMQKNKEQQQLLLKNKILMLEQRALQAMMNPHFVFNVMNSIQHYINTKDTNSANKILTGFAKLIRKNLEICTKSFISLDEELEYLELYLSLEKKRFGEKFKYHIKVNSAIDKEETLIPSMILQPYIENAIWHGLMPKEEGGKLDILIDLKGEDHLVIEIIDDGIGIDNSLKGKKGHHVSKGMNLTRERINLLNQVEANPIQIDIKQNGISGTYVSILIPLYS
ncbi:MAG: two-component regulator propeller domain-containing protein [Candidatus Pedobacter colombiensis]|uniref:Two-component regulator propeller domain-containing protein n=1 Tax=Candidatus Pedobacter colombiensis TaxID=3121371 RepID=A0AAJ6B771_9SPHI|nr:two-component regulator propeller domain-containing protein [Pedobacter sp.]WEK20792.1 MAG: two-component regulator propeller domain-containing protein [Pedobacter sp.]